MRPAQNSAFAILYRRHPDGIGREYAGEFFIKLPAAHQMLQIVWEQADNPLCRQVARGIGIGEYACTDLAREFKLGIDIHQVRRFEHQGLTSGTLQFSRYTIECILAPAKFPAIYRYHLLRSRTGLLMDHLGNVQLTGSTRPNNRHRHVEPGQEYRLVNSTLHIVTADTSVAR